jgi:hypothetical protein
MKRVVSTLAACGAALVLASPGFGQTTPQLQVIPYVTGASRQTDTELDLIIPSAAAAAAKVVLYAPTGYTANLGQAPGTRIADVAATIDARGTRDTLQGQAVADAPARYATDPAAQACAPGAHAAVWVIQLPTPTQTLSLPMYVDPTSGAETSLGAYKIQVCFPSPDVPEAQGGALLGAKIVEADVDFLNPFTNPGRVGAYAWRALVTPYTPGTGTPNVAGTYELRAIAFIPVAFTLRAKYDKKRKNFLISGRLAFAGLTPPAFAIGILGSPTLTTPRFTLVGSARGRRGAFTFRKRLKRTTYLIAFVAPTIDRCSAEIPTIAPAGCASETTAFMFSNPARAVLPKKR